jgi:hypothetical protein
MEKYITQEDAEILLQSPMRRSPRDNIIRFIVEPFFKAGELVRDISGLIDDQIYYIEIGKLIDETKDYFKFIGYPNKNKDPTIYNLAFYYYVNKKTKQITRPSGPVPDSILKKYGLPYEPKWL